MIQDLVELAGLTVNADWKRIKKLKKEYESIRDRIAHGICLKHPETKLPVLQDLTAAYTTIGKLARKPKIDPIATVIPLAQLRAINRNLDKTTDYLRRINTTIRGLLQQSSR